VLARDLGVRHEPSTMPGTRECTTCSISITSSYQPLEGLSAPRFLSVSTRHLRNYPAGFRTLEKLPPGVGSPLKAALVNLVDGLTASEVFPCAPPFLSDAFRTVERRAEERNAGELRETNGVRVSMASTAISDRGNRGRRLVAAMGTCFRVAAAGNNCLPRMHQCSVFRQAPGPR